MKIKIARIITRMDLGGAQKAVLHLSKGLDPALFEQIVITGEGGLLLPELAAIQHIRHFVVSELNRQIGFQSSWTDFKAILKIRKILRSERPQIAHTHTPKAGIVGRWAARLSGVPRIIHTYHGFGFSESHPSWQKRIYIGIERITALITTRFVVVSDRNRLKGQAYGIFPQPQCELIRSGVDFSPFRNQKLDKTQKKMELGLSPSDMIVGIVASFTPPKGLIYFLDTAKKVLDQLPCTLFLMVGDGELRPQLENRIRELGIEGKVKLLGWRRDIPELLQVFDVFLLTSLWEGLPRVLVETMLTGTPVVASNVDGIAEVVQHGKNGFLVAPTDTDAMARWVIHLLRDEELRQRLGKAGQAMAAEFSADRMVEDYARLYTDLMRPSFEAPLAGQTAKGQ